MEEVVQSRRVLSNSWLWWQFIKTTFTNIKRAKVNYCLGFMACYLVVFVVALLVTILSKSPLVFLRLSELDNGEMDTVIRSESQNVRCVNYTLLANEVLNQEPYTAHTPRRMDTHQVYFSSFCPEREPLEIKWKYHPLGPDDYCGLQESCFTKHCTWMNHSAELLIADTEREKKILLGREWPLPALKKGEAYISQSLALNGHAQIGEYVYVSISPFWFFGNETWQAMTGSHGRRDDEWVYIPFKIVNIYSDAHGKYGTSKSSVVMIEYDTFVAHLVDHLDPIIFNDDDKKNVSTINLRHYARYVVVNFPAPRVSAYLESNYDIIQKNVISFANDVFYKIGFTQIETELPVLQGLQRTKIISLFLGLILNIVIFILLFLSILLIYSLLMINVETRTFELGVMRMTGTSRRGIVMLLLIQAFSYALPSWALGIICAEAFTYYLADLFTGFVGIALEPNLTLAGAFWSSFLGLLVPVASAILPIRNALGQNLHDALDTRKSKTAAVKVKLERSDPTQAVNLQLVLLGFGMAIFGSMIYYVFPLALLSFNLGLLLNLFFFLLIGMLLGLTVLALNLQPLVERGVLGFFFFWENRAIRSIIYKNLIAHRVRNHKTTIMYALSLGFIIFISVAYNLQIQTFSYYQQQRNGALLKISSTSFDYSNIKMTNLNQFVNTMEGIASNMSSIIINYAWVSHALENVLMDASYTEVSNIGSIFSYKQVSYAVSPSYYDTSLTKFLQVNNKPNVEDIDLCRYLYSVNGTGGALLSSLYEDGLLLDLDTDFILAVYYRTSQDQTYRRPYRLKPAAFLDSSPGFVYSPFPVIMRQDTIMAFTTLFHIASGRIDSIEDIPLSTFILKLKDGATQADTNLVVAAYQDALSDQIVKIWDFHSIVGPFEVATNAMTHFFNFTTILAMLISFFSLMSSMFTNVYEQTKEIAILRALGITKFWMYRIYIYEAFVLVLSSSVLGLMIGSVVSYTMTLQQVLFTQLPIPFTFPWSIMLTVLLSSVVFSVLAAFSPIHRVLKKSVVQIFRIVT